MKQLELQQSQERERADDHSKSRSNQADAKVQEAHAALEREKQTSARLQGQLEAMQAKQLELEQERDRQRQKEQRLQDEGASLRQQLEVMGSDLAEAQKSRSHHSSIELKASVESTEEPSTSKGQPASTSLVLAEASDEGGQLLNAAYKEISSLNTHLANLYKELTVSRTEIARLRAAGAGAGADAITGGNSTGSSKVEGTPAAGLGVESQKQTQQIAYLMSDCRHLQLDLEYHQQKLDQMVQEKQTNMADLARIQAELAEAKQELEAQRQMLKHNEVDLEHFRQVEASRDRQSSNLPQGDPGTGAGDADMLVALRSEAAAKDSALIVSHYELHKEKLMRDRLEQKNVKLMERMQKLMLVVETMRKENATLEHALQAKHRQCEDTNAQLHAVTAKAKHLGRQVKASKTKAGERADSARQAPALNLAMAAMEREDAANAANALPQLSRSQRSIDSASGRCSGTSTPRATPRIGSSPYTR